MALGLNWVNGSVASLKRNRPVINVGGLGLIVIDALMLTALWSVWNFELQSLIGSFVTPIKGAPSPSARTGDEPRPQPAAVVDRCPCL
jgi:hypothetical protein